MAKENRITARERRLLNGLFAKEPSLNGNNRKITLGQAINRIASIMAFAGYSLDMVSGDLLMGPKGSRQLRFRRAHPVAFEEFPEVENSVVSFTWENMSRPVDGIYRNDTMEVIAYVS